LPSLQALFSTSSFVLPIPLHDRDGRVRLLTSTGVVVADPKLLPENSTTPVLLTQMAMDGQTVAAYGNAGSTQTVANLKTLDLPLRLPPTHRHLEFDFTAFHFSAPENIRFRYKLAGFDNDWIEAGGVRNADYSRLTAGHYEFQVAACVGGGPWNESPAALAFTVTPFFWQTWWFRLGALLLFTSAIIAIMRYVSFRRMQLKLRAAEQLVAVERERGRIARDLHDDLGGSLNLAALTLDLTEDELEDQASLNGKIQRCSTLVRQAARSVDEIVWAINPRNDTLVYLVDYISQFAVEFLQAADILCLVELPDSIPNQRISPEARHNLWLVSKEAVNNIVRHAHAGEVHLRVTVSENHLAVSIKDNGRGFEWPQDNAGCDGLRNMRQRMEEIGGKFQLNSQPGTGTHIVLLYSWPPQT
jgi:signal transduction histidine kinase